MKKTIFIIFLIMCIFLSGCETSQDIEASPIPTQKATPESISAPTQTSNNITPNISPMPTPSSLPTQTQTIVEELLPVFGGKVNKLDVDRTYANNILAPDEFVFDDEYMYYINETRVVKRSLKTNEASVILDGVYDNKHLSIQDGWLYLYAQGTGIIKVKTDGTESETIRDVQASRVMAVGDNVYYYAADRLFEDWEYSLFNFNINTNENTLLKMFGVAAKYQNGYLYYTKYDGLVDYCNIYNIETKSDVGFSIACHHLPIIVNDIAYHFYNGGDFIYEDYYLYTKNALTGEQSIIYIEGRNLMQYYNYLLFVDDSNNLCAYDTRDGIIYEIMPFKDTTIESTHGDTIFISKILNSGITRIYSMDLTVDTDIKKLFSYEREYSYLPDNKDLPHISDIDINEDYDYGKFMAVNYSTGDSFIYEDIEYCFKYEYDYSNKKPCHCLYDSTNQEIVLEDILATYDFPVLFMNNDKIVYTNIDNPGYLYVYNIELNQTEIYNTSMGVPVRFTPYYQYLIIDSYYKEFNYSYIFDDGLDPVEINPIYSFVLNMETGEIAEVVNDILKHPESR